MTMQLFAQIRKVDEERRLVFGRAAQEMVDKSNEVMDYESSKPHFVKWSEDISKDTDGKSLGNIRAMHGKVAAGKITQIDFNDAEKAIDVCGKIVDDQEWKKVMEGVYTGFSIGGKYIGDKKVEKANGQDVTRYTAGPSEISLVDRPCIPSAKFFEIQKLDGSVATVEFKAPADEDIEKDAEGVVEGTAEQVDQLTKLMADNGLNMEAVLAAVAESVEKKELPVEKADAAPEGIGQDKWDGMSAEDKAKYKAGLKAGTEPDGDEDTGKLWEATMAKLEAALGEAKVVLTKVGARNSAADKSRINAIHNAAAELGADCPMAGKADAAVDLTKIDLTKVEGFKDVLDKAIAAATDPLQKEITKLKEQPAPSRIKLRAVGKGEDYQTDDGKGVVEKIVDSHGEEHEVAGLIKGLHQKGGAPLMYKG